MRFSHRRLGEQSHSHSPRHEEKHALWHDRFLLCITLRTSVKMVKHINSEEDFKDAINSQDKLVVVDFFATWCGPCKMITPLIAKWEAGDHCDVVFCKVDVDEMEELTAEYKISAMPTLLFFKGGQKVEEVVGANTAKIEETIKRLK